jgi:hypothetical protein
MSDRSTEGQLPLVYVIEVGGRTLVLDEEGLLRFVRRMFIERELGLPAGTLTDEQDEVGGE